jgi:hypothetical protein
MEVVNKNGECKPVRNNGHRALIALAFIVAGLLLFGKNQGVVSGDVVKVVVSWQMLLIVLGLSMLIFRRAVVPGSILIGIGGFFMLPLFLGYREMGEYWPLIFVVIGVVMLVSILCGSKYNDR